MTESEEKVLLLSFARRGEEEMIRQAMSALRGELPEAEVAAVGTPISAPVLRALGVERVIVYGERRGAREVVRQTQRHRPAAAGIVYGGPEFSGHLKLELLAWLSGARRIYRFRPDGTASSTGKLGIVCSICGKALGAAVRLVAGVVVCAAAFCCLRAAQLLAGGHRASRA